MNALMVLALLGQVGETGQQSYDRAFQAADETGEAQPILFTRGTSEAREVAHFVAMLRAQDVPTPHIIDLDEAGPEVQKMARDATNGNRQKSSFLQTIHPKKLGHYRYGPKWLRMKNVRTAERYTSWVQKDNKAPAAQKAANYNCYPCKKVGFFRRLFGRRRCCY